jgi:hypothetical protein
MNLHLPTHTTGRKARWLNLALVLAVVALATGCATTTAHVTHTPTVTVVSTSTLPPQPAPTPVWGLLAPPPSDCQAVAAPHRMTLSADFGAGFVGGDVVTGASPAWQFGLTSHASPLDLEPTGPTPYPGTKVVWIVGPTYGKPVTLQGHDLRTGTPMWFALLSPGSNTAAARSVALNPAMPNRGGTDTSAGHWNVYGVGIIFTVAGCYE